MIFSCRKVKTKHWCSLSHPGKISWILVPISLRSVRSRCSISACLAAALKAGYLKEKLVAPGNWDIELGCQWQPWWATEKLWMEGSKCLSLSPLIKLCKTNWNAMLSVQMTWVRSTCHRRHKLHEVLTNGSWGRVGVASAKGGKNKPARVIHERHLSHGETIHQPCKRIWGRQK